jgi:hypothetical protein
MAQTGEADECDCPARRPTCNGDWLLRAAAAMAGIYGNSPAEAVYPLLATDSTGNKPDTSTNRYTLTFPDGGLPPDDAAVHLRLEGQVAPCDNSSLFGPVEGKGGRLTRSHHPPR